MILFLNKYFNFKYVVKILMGGVDSWFDDLDEKKVRTDDYGRANNGPKHKRKLHCIIL